MDRRWKEAAPAGNSGRPCWGGQRDDMTRANGQWQKNRATCTPAGGEWALPDPNAKSRRRDTTVAVHARELAVQARKLERDETQQATMAAAYQGGPLPGCSLAGEGPRRNSKRPALALRRERALARWRTLSTAVDALLREGRADAAGLLECARRRGRSERMRVRDKWLRWGTARARPGCSRQ
jgi:hypothetical protein